MNTLKNIWLFLKSIPVWLYFAVVLAAGAYFLRGYLDNQERTIVTLSQKITDLEKKNSDLVSANKKIVEDVKVVNALATEMNKKMVDIDIQVKSLHNKTIGNKKFQTLVMTNLPEAEVMFNSIYNGYLVEINQLTVQNEK